MTAAVAIDSGGQSVRYKYSGQEQDNTWFYDYHARLYDPALGRFISADTIVPQPGNPQSLNRYAYTLNNPLKYMDPTGHYVFEETPDDPDVRWLTSRWPMVRSAHWWTAPEDAMVVPPYPAGGGFPQTFALANATVVSIGFYGGVGKIYALGSIDLVSTRYGDIALFITVRDSKVYSFLPGVPDDIGQAEEWLMACSDDAFPLYTPQVGTGVMKGVAFGEAFDTKGAMAYQGPFLNSGGGWGMYSGNIFTAFDAAKALASDVSSYCSQQLNTSMWGVEVGTGASAPSASAYVNATYSIPTGFHKQLPSWLIPTCQYIGMCGR